MSFNSYDQLITSLTTGKRQDVFFNKPSITAVAGFWYRLWNAAGFPGAGADLTAGTGFPCNKDTVGAMPLRDPAPGNTMHLVSLGVGGITAGVIGLYDRIWHAGGIQCNSASLQTLASNAPTRYTDGKGNQLMIEVTTALGTGASTLTINYTNQDGVAGRQATLAMTASSPANRCYMVALQAGDTGVRTVESVQLSAAMSAGVINIVMFNAQTLITLPYAANGYSERDLVMQLASLPEIQAGACLSLMIYASATSTGYLNGKLTIAEG